MKLKNISVGDSVQLKKRLVSNIFRKKQVCEVIKIDSEHEFRPDVLVKGEYCLGWVNHKDLKKPIQLEPEPKLKVLDQSVFDGLDAKWRFAAVDGDGGACVYAERPELRLNRCHFYHADLYALGGDYDTTDWQNSLIERDKVELTGSDLTEQIMKKQKYQPAFVSDESEQDALNSQRTALIDNVYMSDRDYRFRAELNGYRYAVAINNQGEPLTQLEAGL